MSDEPQIASTKDFEVDAFDILQSAPDYNSGVNSLISSYKDKQFDSPEEASRILSDYGADLRHKFKEAPLDFSEVLDIAPIKPTEIQGETTVDKINAWEKANIDSINESKDPDYLAVKDPLTTAIKNYASESRRDELGDRGEGLWAWSTDKFYRGAEGAVGSIAKLLGADELDKDLYERTQRSRDEGLAGKVFTGAGAIVPSLVAGAVTGGAGALVVMAAQAGGEARGAYEKSLEATGDPTRALESGALTGVAQATALLPLGRAASSLASGVLTKFGTEAIAETAQKTLNEALITSLNAQKKTFGNVALSTLEAGTAGGAGAIIGNVASNIGLDKNGDITHGAADAFLANAIVGGTFSGAHALLENAAVEQMKHGFKDADTELNKPNPEKLKDVNVTEPQFFKDSDGYWVEQPKQERTFDEQVADKVKYDEAVHDYVNEPVEYSPDKITTETGEEIALPHFQDYETDIQPSKTVLVGEGGGLRPNRFVTYLASKLGGTLELSKNIVDGAFGAYSPGTGKIKVLRSLGADPVKFSETLAHEVGHFIDGYLNKAFSQSTTLKTLAGKLTGIQELVHSSVNEHLVNSLGKVLSAEWRPGWNPLDKGDAKSTSPAERFAAYRARPEEVYADIVSAILNSPEFVRTKYPEIYNAFEKGLARDTELNTFWNTFQKLASDPNEISNFNMQVAKESRQKQGQIEAAVRLNQVQNNSYAERLSRNSDLAYQTVFNRLSPAKQVVKNLSGEAREVGFDMFNDLQRKDYVHDYLTREIDTPLKQVFQKSIQAEIDPNTWAHYEWAKKIRDETTPVIENIKLSPDIYRKAADVIREYLEKDPHVKKSILNEYFKPEKLTDAEGITEAFANIGLIGDSSEVLNMQDFLQKYDPADPTRNQKAKRDYQLAMARLNKRAESIPIEKLKDFIKKYKGSGELEKALQDVVTPSAFSVRRFLVNAGGASLYDAKRDLVHISDSLGVDKFKALEKISAEYHSTLSKPLSVIADSGIFSPDLLAGMQLNRGSYVTNNVLKHFEGDESVSAAVRTAIGSLSETGNELNSTSLKVKAITTRAYYQRGVNGAVEIAKLANVATLLEKAHPGFDIFAEKSKLSKSDPDNSYLIQYKEGSPSLYKIPGKGYEKMFESYRGGPVANLFLDTTDLLNKALLTRHLKTVFSPAFVTFQKFYDRKLEAIMANSLEVTLGLPVHTSKGLREIDASTKQELNHYKETGELTGGLKTAVGLDSVLLHLSAMETEGVHTGNSFEDTVYEAFGAKLPDQKNILEKAGIYTEKALDKLGGQWLKNIAEFDEIRTKINGFKIGKDMLGMSDAEAAVFARERFGVPDPLGGGTAAPLLNRMFLFGRAHLNGLRVLGSFLKDTPKTAATQISARVILPKLAVIGPLMYQVMKQVRGQEDADKYQSLLNMIPSFEKLSKNIIPLGFQDAKGNYHNFFDVKSTDIQSDWKAWYVRLPQARELTTVAKVMWPFINNLFQGDVTQAVSQGLQGASSQAVAGIQPMIQYAVNLGQIAFGYNPTDFYRMKGILDKDVVAGGSLGRKLYDWSKYAAAQQAPSAVPYNPFSTTPPQGTGETVIQKVPFVGPMVRSFLGISNYGLLETNKAADAEQNRVKASIILSSGDKTTELLSEYRIAAGKISSIGKGWRQEVGPDVARQMSELTTWHTRIWTPYQHELLASLEAKDSARYQYLLNQLEQSSRSVLQTVKGVSEFPQEKEGSK